MSHGMLTLTISAAINRQRVLVSDGAGCVIDITIPSATDAGAAMLLPMEGESKHCVLFGVDIAQFTRADRDDEVQLALREALYRMLIASFDHSGVSWCSCIHEDRGDGAIVILPAEIPAITIVSRLVDDLRTRLRRHNRLASEAARLRLRLAAHIGEVHRDQYGLAGDAVNHLFRILDASELREALGATDAELALIISDPLYRSVVEGASERHGSASYSKVIVQVKQFQAQAWVLGAAG